MTSSGRHASVFSGDGLIRPVWLGPAQLAFLSGTYLIVYRASRDGIEVARVSGADEDLKLDQ